jgi:hypothetical protein
MIAVTHSIFRPNIQYIYASAFFTARPNTVPASIRQQKINNPIKISEAN